MSLFQKSVIKKYKQSLNSEILKSSWNKFVAHFNNPVIQEHIRNSKEEEYQEGFVRDLFVNVLGYTLKPQPNYNFVLERKTETDATKSDGALLNNNNVIGVVELKDTETTELEKIEKQVFGYKNKHRHCSYIVTSNFEKLRFYIEDSVDFIDFDLFNLNEDQFSLLFLCLGQQCIEKGLPLKMKQASLAEEENITKELYSEYSDFKSKLFTNLIELNPQFDRLEMFKKTQKLLDRFLFLLFAEDRLLLPPNSVRSILDEWEKLKDMDNYVPLYSRFSKFFGYLNTGYNWRNGEIFAYNGGLFAADNILDNVIIDDKILYEGSRQLSSYDFESEIDVNILGHIFEHSLSEIEEMQAHLAGGVTLKSKTKRRKDGVFYTPRYITKYMVEHSLKEHCNGKKRLLNIVESEFIAKKFKTGDAEEKRKKKLLKILNDYRFWLFELSICDPACGSGAFLNQALEFLISEHRFIDELQAKLFGDAIVLSDVESMILERNLFGVDINEEAVEIARLSLWLRTARPGRKLNDLSKNIKYGNSLIDDQSLVGNSAFNWSQQFPEIFKKGGFDIIIGNPPYVDVKSLQEQIKKHIFKVYKSANNRINLFGIFIEKGLSILGSGGYFSFIIPSALLTQESYKGIREILLSNSSIKGVVRLPNESFGGGAGEVKVDTIILTVEKGQFYESNVDIIIYKGFERINEVSELNCDQHFIIRQSEWATDKDCLFRINANEGSTDLISKIETGSKKLVDCADFSLGLTPYDKYKGHSEEQIANRVFHSTLKKDHTFQMLLAGNDVRRYFVSWGGEEWISYGPWLGAPREKRFFTEKRIVVKQIIDWSDKRIWAALTDEELYNSQNAFNLIAKADYYPEYLVAVLNSRLMTFYLRKKYLEEFKDRFQKILIKDCKEFPIKPIEKWEQSPFVEIVSTIVAQTKVFNTIRRNFTHFLSQKFQSVNVSKKLENWPFLDSKEFIRELSKQKIKITISEEAEWLKFFEERKAIATLTQKEIYELDIKIDRLIFDLYGLTESEIENIISTVK